MKKTNFDELLQAVNTNTLNFLSKEVRDELTPEVSAVLSVAPMAMSKSELQSFISNLDPHFSVEAEPTPAAAPALVDSPNLPSVFPFPGLAQLPIQQELAEIKTMLQTILQGLGLDEPTAETGIDAETPSPEPEGPDSDQ